MGGHRGRAREDRWTTAEPKLPPVRIARVIDSVRRRLHRLDQKLVPAPIAVLDMMTGAFFTRAIYAAAKFGSR
jgi:hypothetical protein